LVILTMFPNGTSSGISSAPASVLSKRKLRAIDAIRIARPAEHSDHEHADARQARDDVQDR
jgi:hypothetical protein